MVDLKSFSIPFLFALISVTSLAKGKVTPVSMPRENATAYATLDGAAMAALKECKAHSKQVEWGGCLYTKNGKFYFTEPVTNNSSEDFKARCLTPKNSMIGLFHTHPLGSAEGFSEHDLNLADKMNLTSYLLSIPSSNVMRSSPKKYRSRYGKVIGRIR